MCILSFCAGMSNEVDHETLQALYEMRRTEVSRLEKELSECKMQSQADIDNLRKKLLISESENQRTVMEYQRQCGNKIVLLKKIINIVKFYRINIINKK